MSMLAVLIPLGLVLVVIAVLIFFWAVRSGQFEDMDSPAWQIVLDDDRQPQREKGDEEHETKVNPSE